MFIVRQSPHSPLPPLQLGLSGSALCLLAGLTMCNPDGKHCCSLHLEEEHLSA